MCSEVIVQLLKPVFLCYCSNEGLTDVSVYADFLVSCPSMQSADFSAAAVRGWGTKEPLLLQELL